MKKLSLIIALCISLFAQEETTQENLNKYLTGVPETQCLNNLNLENFIKKSDDGNALFTFILDGADLSTGRLTYNVYKVNEEFNSVEMGINKEVDKISFTNPSCNYSKIEPAELQSMIQENGLSNYANKNNERNNQLNTDLKELENKYLGKDAQFTQTGDKKYLTTASYLLACFTFNENIIDIKQSLQLNRIILKPGYTIHPNNQVEKVEVTEVSKGFASIASSIRKKVETTYNDVVLDSVSEYLSDNVILFLFDFRSNWNDIILEMKTFLFLTFIPFSVGFLSLSKITKKISKINDFDDIAEKGIMVVILLFMFYFTNGTTNKVDASNGEDKNINLSNFQKFSSNFFSKSMEYADKSANVFSKSYINFKRKSAGYLTDQEIVNILENSASSEKQKTKINLFLDACKRDWNIDEVRNRFNITTKKEVISFPNQQQFNNFIDSSRSANNIEQFLNEGIPYPIISLTGCYNFERENKELKNLIANNKTTLDSIKDTQEEQSDREQILKIAKVQYYSTAEQGFLAIPQVAVTNIVTDNLNMFGAGQSQDKLKAQSEKIKEENKLDDGWDNLTKPLFSNLAYMMVPGAGAIKEFVSDGGSQLFEKIPVLGKLVGSLVGTGVAVGIMKYFVLYFPVIALSMASLMVIGWYFISVFIYFLVSPFIIVYALSQQQTDTIKDFLIRGVALAFKPILIILSVVVAVVAVDLFKDLSIILFETNFALLVDLIKTQDKTMLSWFFIFLRGVLEVGTSIVATVSAFYLVFNGAEMILGMFGFKQSGIDVKEVVGSAVEGKTSKYNNPGA
jgi:hypothetical protein